MFRVLFLAMWAILFSFQIAIAEDVAQHVADLNDDDFAVREQAQAKLIELGEKVIAAEASKGAPALDAPQEKIVDFLIALEENLGGKLQGEIFEPLDAAVGPEGKFRAKQIHRTLTAVHEKELNKVKAKYPIELPADQAKRVLGYTGGFREGTTWFDAEFHNNSSYQITAIRILVRTTHSATGIKKERTVLLQDIKKPMEPGATAKRSIDTGISRNDGENFYWETLNIYGVLKAK